MQPTPLHTAVWDNNNDLLSHLLLQPEGIAQLEALDSRGNTPLLLAYRMGRTEAARMLLAAGCFSKPRTAEGWEAIHVSSLTGNPDLVRTSVMAYLKETNAAFERRLPQLQANFELMPDFVLTMKWEFKSWLPLVSMLLPSDTYSIYKRGSSLRLDSTLLGMNGLKWERGNLSLLLWGRNMPVPGSVRVLDWDNKTESDARLAFTHPKDQQVQDWVRKLLTTPQKCTDWWSRDAVLAPAMKKSLLSSLFALGGLGGSSATPPKGRATAASAAAAAAAAAAAPPLVHKDDPNQVMEDVGVWGPCACYDLKNLCVTDISRAPILPSLPLEQWWRPEYSQEINLEQAQQLHAADAAAAASASAAAAAAATSSSSPSAAGGGGGSSSTGGGSTAAVADLSKEAEPERQLAPLLAILQGIRSGRITESTAASAGSLAQLEGMGFGGEGGGPGEQSGSQISTWTFEEFFGTQRAAASAGEREAAASAAAASAASGEAGQGGEGAGASASAGAGATTPAAVYVHGDGLLHRPSGAVAESREESLTTDEKSLDLKVYFSKEFPITTAQFLPVAEVMARTGAHAENFKRFFSSKMPVGAGFPVRFTIPVFPTITATITFELCETRRAVPLSNFEVPKDFAVGAYVERGWIRQL